VIVETRRKAKYPQRLSVYASSYGRSIETIKAWVKRGKLAGRLPPLQSPAQFPDWYAEHVGAVPDDLLSVCSSGAVAVSRATNGSSASNGQAESVESVAAVPLLDLEQAVIEIRAILAQDIAELKRSSNSDSRRGVLLRHVQKTSDSLCKLENTLAGLRREHRDALPWSVFENAIADILARLVDIRKGMPARIIAEIEKLYSHRVARVIGLIREPLLAAIAKVCEQDMLVLANCPELQPVYEKMRQRQRELEAADHAKT
jgi:hypothetical protein